MNTQIVIPETVLASFEKIKKLRETTKDINAFRPSGDWYVLFSFYNNNLLKTGERGLGMSCFPCFGKVFNRVKEHIDA